MIDNTDLIEEKEVENKKLDLLEDESCKLKIYLKFLNIIYPL